MIAASAESSSDEGDVDGHAVSPPSGDVDEFDAFVASRVGDDQQGTLQGAEHGQQQQQQQGQQPQSREPDVSLLDLDI